MTHKQARRRRKKLAARVAGGESRGSVARAIGVCPETVQMACREHGVGWVREDEAPATNMLRIVAALFDRRRTYNTIGTEFGISRQRIQRIYRKAIEAGIPVPERQLAKEASC